MNRPSTPPLDSTAPQTGSQSTPESEQDRSGSASKDGATSSTPSSTSTLTPTQPSNEPPAASSAESSTLAPAGTGQSKSASAPSSAAKGKAHARTLSAGAMPPASPTRVSQSALSAKTLSQLGGGSSIGGGSGRDRQPSASSALTSSSGLHRGQSSYSRSDAATETESIVSVEDFGEVSDAGLGYEEGHQFGQAKTAKGGTSQRTRADTKGKGAAVNPAMRRASTAPLQPGRGPKGRSVSRSRGRADDTDDDDEDEGQMVRARAMSPAPALLNAASQNKEEDDEVERIDRGEELVRKRWKEKQRLKKEAEKARKREALHLQPGRRLSQHPTSFAVDYDPSTAASMSSGLLSPRPAMLRGTSSSRAVSSTSHAADSSFGLGLPSVSTPAAARRDQSRSGLRESIVTPAESMGSESGARTISGYFGHEPNAGSYKETPGGDRSVGGAPLSRGVSHASTTASTRNAPSAKDDGSDAEPEMDGDMFHDRRESSATMSARPDIAQSETSHMVDESVGTDFGELSEEGGSGTGETDDASDDESIDGDVEYTLKDRQDAINVEHPFGLPIWKPALYKKNRSIARNAEAALHATPSSSVVRHLAPGNIVWTIFFGSWLALICAIISAILWLTPWGGEKYGRVIWELAGYLFWPFGKYVEGWTDGEGDEVEGESAYGDPDASDRTVSDIAEDDAGERREEGKMRDEEEAGRTFSRSRGRQLASGQGGDPVPSRRSVIELHDREGDDTEGSAPAGERSTLLAGSDRHSSYGSTQNGRPGGAQDRKASSSHSSSDRTVSGPTWRPHDFSKDSDGQHTFRVRALGRVMYWVTFYLVVAPLMLIVCLLCWGMVFTVPMAKLLWVLVRHLDNEPLSLHFRSPPDYIDPKASSDDASNSGNSSAVHYPLRPGQPAPKVSREEVDSAKRHGRLVGPHSTVLLCTYRAAGLQYYKYTVDGVNIMFVNLLSLVAFVIIDFFILAPRIVKADPGGFLSAIASPGFMFVLALLSVIPLSYFIGMAVASISAQSSIGMGGVINASFGSGIEIILYSIALADGKANLVEGSLIGSLLAGVLLMPGASMISGAMRRKEQRFNARSAGVTSTMLIMAIIGILTPTLFYEIYGAFQLTCSGCDPSKPGDMVSCSTCYYEHVDPADDPFFRNTVRPLAYYCAILLVTSYLIGLWFSLRTHASQIWQNAQHKVEEGHRPQPQSANHTPAHTMAHRDTHYKRVLPNQLLSKRHDEESTPISTPNPRPMSLPTSNTDIPAYNLPQGMTPEDLSQAFETVAAADQAMPSLPPSYASRDVSRQHPGAPARQHSHVKEASNKTEHDGGGGGGGEDEAGGHDAPNWSRLKSASVLMICTALYALIAEILVDAVDVVLDGSGIPEKFLGVTLFALVPNTTEFLNAISFALNGNIALSMEIGSAYALQVCLIQAPAMLAFSAFYALSHDSLLHHTFTLVFPRWDVIAIMFSVFLLTYTYIEARANYYRGSILCLSYLVLLGGFAWAPGGRDTSDNPGFTLLQTVEIPSALSAWQNAQAVVLSLFSR